MAEDNLHPSPEEIGGPPPEPGTDNGPAQNEPGNMVVDFDKINELMAQRRAAERAKVEARETDAPAVEGDTPEPPSPGSDGQQEHEGGHDEDTPGAPTPTKDEDGPALPDGDAPTLKVDVKSTKVIDIGTPGARSGEVDDREPWEKTQEELDAEKKKPKRGRPPKAKTGQEADKRDKPRKGRPPKDKAASGRGKALGDKVSQGKPSPEQPAAGGVGPAVPPASEQQEASQIPRSVENQKIVYMKISEMHPFHTFRAHPFRVRDDAKMQETVASIKVNGVMVPGIARPEKDGNGYEIIAGHRRCRASELAGLEEMPFIIRDMSDHEAVQTMKDTNKQRDQILPSELAALLELEVEDIKHQGTRLKGVAEGDIGKRSVEIVGESHNINYKKVMRYLRLNSLVPELLDKVDGVLDENGKRVKGLGFMPAVELSYIRPKNQQLIAVSIDGEQASPSVAQAKRLRELDQKNLLNGDVIDQILSEEKKEVDKVIITTDELNQYFGKEVTPRQMKDQIMALLDEWKEKQPLEKNAPEQAAEL